MNSCSRCRATDTRLIPAHWADLELCPDCCHALYEAKRIPEAIDASPTISVERVIELLGAHIIPTGDNPYGLNTDTHTWTRCDECGKGSMVKNTTTPRCRNSPHCPGKHRAGTPEPTR